MYKLKTIGSPYKQFSLKTGAYRLGSAPDSEFFLDDASVAPYHCEMVVTSKITLRDISPNKETFLDEEQFESAELKPGQILRLGQVKLVLEEDGPESAAAAQPKKARSSQPKLSGVLGNKAVRKKLFERYAMPVILLALLSVIGVLLYHGYQLSAAKKAEEDQTAEEGPKKKKIERKPKPPPERQAEKKPAARAEDSKSNETDEHGTRGHVTHDDDDKDESLGPGVPDLPLADNQGIAGISGPRSPGNPNLLPGGGSDRFPRRSDDPRVGPLLEQALRNQEKALGPNHPAVAKTLDTLGQHYEASGQLDKAQPYLQKALANTEKNRGPNHPETAAALNNLGALLAQSGKYDKAEPLLERALGIREKALDPKQPEIGLSQNNLAALKTAEKDYAKAAPMMKQALKSFAKSLSMGDPAIPDSLNKLAALNQAKGDLANAERYTKAALDITDIALGPDHPAAAESLKRLAKLEQQKGNKAKAQALMEQAAKKSEKALGPNHPKTEEKLDELARMSLCDGEAKQAREQAVKALKVKHALLNSMISCASEQQLLGIRDRLSPYSFAVVADSVPDLASAVLQFKGVVMDALMEQRLVTQPSDNPDVLLLADDLRDTKDQLAPLMFDTADADDTDGPSQKPQKEALQKKLKRLETGLGVYVPGIGRARRALNVSVDQVKRALSDDTVLLEFIRYSRCAEKDRWEPCYGVIVIPNSGTPTWVSLGVADAIDKNIERFRSELVKSENGPVAPKKTNAVAHASLAPSVGAGKEQRSKTNAPPAETVQEPSFSGVLHGLHEQLWQPLQAALPAGARNVLISPDAALSLVSFATLLTPEDEFLSQKYSIHYVSSGRDLLKEKERASSSPSVIFANPDFSVRWVNAAKGLDAATSVMRDEDRHAWLYAQLPRLVGSNEEAVMLELMLQRHKQKAVSFVGASGSETQANRLAAPRVVQLSTGGFFLPRTQQDAEAADQGGAADVVEGPGFMEMSTGNRVVPASASLPAGKKPVSNPLHRGGIVLAGAASTLKAWGNGDIPPLESDGILTADEVSTLKLSGTELVILSASDVSLGSIRSGEAILGLRRGFIQAGADSLLIRLRSADDEASIKFLQDFYDRFLTEGSASRALTEVQREWLVRLRKERGLSAAVQLAGAYFLNSVR